MTTIPFHDPAPVLRITNLKVQFAGSPVSVLDGISLSVKRGETLALVGESGCGKSITSLALMGLLPTSAQIVSGEMHFRDQDLRQLAPRDYADLRGNALAMIFQEPMTSLNPAFTLGDQLSEAVMRHQNVSRSEAMAAALQTLEKVQIPAPEMRLKAYPHQLSGGMRQRVMIAMALINNPRLLIADEPTTALDVTIQAQILALLNTLKAETGTAVLMITHDLGVVAEVAQQVAVMYAGQVVEQGSVEAIFADPQHPYTIGLMGSIPSLGARKGPLSTIPGAVPLPEAMPKGCRFATRCPFAQTRCHQEKPTLQPQGPGHLVACFRAPLEQHIALGETA
ncbi:ABC transporter ATP-binding protein [Kosakonia sp. S58]|uniref:ABC transporter ATP-binding protein n=1 Tax=unclassified Kosakonia TaxID=2632876 RepID=UPI001907A2C1|nr:MULTISPECIES: ABC transporter ATP-binding protein [unclassified Kosakonia]MBK0081894.1 ABC transporter ATP-binding protein [Kosakonia sp. S57]MBK0088900.1 ABC transporter ATP-binding protein [Kosakonia sp. S58]